MNLGIAIEYFESCKIQFEHILQMVSGFSELEEVSWSDAMSALHDGAGRLPWAGDYDFGAMALEAEARKPLSPKLQRFLLQNALLRAEWCTDGATARGEELARQAHVDKLKAKLEACT